MPRRELAELHATLLAALAVGCSSSTPRQEPPPEVVVVPDPPPPAPSRVAPPGPAPKQRGYVNVNGAVNRLGPTTCPTDIPTPACRGDERNLQCKTDADCTEGPNGKCVSGAGQIGSFCGCRYSCATDADCGDDEVCVCRDVVPTDDAGRYGGGSVCAPASCRSPADCDGGACGVSSYHNGCGRGVRLDCRSDGDRCHSDADCGRGQQCASSGEGFSCQSRSCAIGRPLQVAGELRTAAPVHRQDWAAPMLLSLDHFSVEERTAARRHYLDVAALEHASVGSFARFTLQLLALGAPAELLADTQAAALDEVRHAQLMYGVASALGAGDVGPGPLAATEAPPTDPAAVLEALVEAGCVGETLGAAEAAVAAGGCDGDLAQTLRSVADDEGRHAALAWRTLAWMIARWPALRPRARTAVARHVASPPAPAAVSLAVPALGVLPAPAVAELRRATLAAVVRPLADELLA